MSIRNKKLDRRYNLMERRQTAGPRRIMMVESLFEAFRAGRLIPARVAATNTFHWPAPPGER